MQMSRSPGTSAGAPTKVRSLLVRLLCIIGFGFGDTALAPSQYLLLQQLFTSLDFGPRGHCSGFQSVLRAATNITYIYCTCS